MYRFGFQQQHQPYHHTQLQRLKKNESNKIFNGRPIRVKIKMIKNMDEAPVAIYLHENFPSTKITWQKFNLEYQNIFLSIF